VRELWKAASRNGEETVLGDDEAHFSRSSQQVGCSFWMLVTTNKMADLFVIRHRALDLIVSLLFGESRTKAIRCESMNEVLMQSAEIARLHTIARCTIVFELRSTRCLPIFTLFHDDNSASGILLCQY